MVKCRQRQCSRRKRKCPAGPPILWAHARAPIRPATRGVKAVGEADGVRLIGRPRQPPSERTKPPPSTLPPRVRGTIRTSHTNCHARGDDSRTRSAPARRNTGRSARIRGCRRFRRRSRPWRFTSGPTKRIQCRNPSVRYPHGMDRRVGTRAPDVALADGRRLHDALRGGRFVLLGPSTATIDPPPQVDVVEQPGVDRWRLIRPDGYVGWVGTPEEFPSWAERYFRWRASPKPLGARR